MAKSPLSEAFQKESEVMIKVTSSYISKMMQNKTLTVEKVEILNLQMAAKYGCFAIMHVLLTTGKADVNKFDSIRGNTALHFAAYFKQLEMVKMLIKFGAKIIKNKDELTAVDIAKDRDPEIYKYLISNPEKIEHKEMEVSGEIEAEELVP